MTGKKLFIAGGVFLALAALTWLIPVGYGTSALCLAGLGAVCFFYGFVARRGAKRLGVAGAAALAVCFVLFLAAEIPVIRDARSDRDTAADYIIVMGAGINGTTPSMSLSDRLEAALAWLEENPAGIAVVSGSQGDDEPVPEARVMRDWLTARGIAPERVLMETEAGSSYENILFSLAVIRENGGDPTGRVALVSSEYHLCRLRYIAARLGCQPVAVAARSGHFSLAVNYGIREAAAMWKCWLLGIE